MSQPHPEAWELPARVDASDADGLEGHQGASSCDEGHEDEGHEDASSCEEGHCDEGHEDASSS